MPNTVIYARISKDDHDDGLGVDRQQKLCRQLAKRAGLAVQAVLVDNDFSAYRSKKRPAFEELVELLKTGEVDAVVCYHADRLYRRTTDLERLVTIVEATGAQVHTVAAGDIDLTSASGRRSPGCSERRPSTKASAWANDSRPRWTSSPRQGSTLGAGHRSATRPGT